KNFGRHGDIKPENILWFHEKGQNRLVITDFGLTRYHSFRSKSNNPYENLEGLTPTYRPPEVDLKMSISPRYDVWALGCVFIQFLSWYLLGDFKTHNTFATDRLTEDESLASYVQEDKFFNVLVRETNRESYAVVKPSVKKWIQRLHSHENCPGFVHDFLSLIEEHLLIIDPKERWACD
ncbi:kinase-like protein, partial [Thozetella sp. PMI_491]